MKVSAMKPLKREFLKRVGDTHDAADVLGFAALNADTAGKEILSMAHCYLYAALVSDFVLAAEKAISTDVRMPDGSVKNFREFLFEHCFDSILAPIMKKPDGEEFIEKVRIRAKRMLW